MSATNRGRTVRRHLDYYSTPRWCVNLMLSSLGRFIQGNVLDPGCGVGEIFIPLLRTFSDINVVGIELDKYRAKKSCKKGAKIINTDFLTSKKIEKYAPFDTVIMNPPFTYAFEFWARALELVKPGGSIISFARMGLMESRARIDMWQDFGWATTIVIARRPFPDAANYGWFHWIKGYRGSTKIERPSIPDYDY